MPDINALRRDEYRRYFPSDLRDSLDNICEMIEVYWRFGVCAERSVERIIEDAVHERLPKTEKKARETGVEVFIGGYRYPMRSFKDKLKMLVLPCHLLKCVIRGETVMKYFKDLSPDIKGQLEVDLYEDELLSSFFNHIDERLKSDLDPSIEFMKEYRMKLLDAIKEIISKLRALGG
jgi:hypothetical protein